MAEGARTPLTVDLGLHQIGREVLARPDPALLGQRHAVLGDLVDHLDNLGELSRGLVVPDPQHHARPVEDLVLVLFGDTHHVADDLQRKRTRYLGHEVGTRVGIVIFASVIGMSFGGWISGVIFDSTGSYAAAFINGLAWNALNLTICIALLLRARRRMVLASQG